MYEIIKEQEKVLQMKEKNEYMPTDYK